MNKQFDTLRAQVEALLKEAWSQQPKGHCVGSSDDQDSDTSLPQHEEQCKRCKPPPRNNPQECDACLERNASQGEMPIQQEGYKSLQQVIRYHVASEVDSIKTMISLDDEVKHWEHKAAAAAR